MYALEFFFFFFFTFYLTMAYQTSNSPYVLGTGFSLPSNIQDICKRHFNVIPKQGQLDVVSRIGEGKDTILIAGCGWGKYLVGTGIPIEYFGLDSPQ
ncbi:hypothetical protein BCR41DRAFT_147020 [Lobosporangium transversale]|uniref:Methyltransferase type 11 domain-containing protein n=1 Tax=Lobosporangium transversale TaxID=64571 RepID=A0A1Y2GE09_9FUNG|nr:hypothetical protein BCR41DRAFT_147020 [Lobosporangium transversale]ORZ08230.1 hypothetical protein BCR41DRAFT_147020 [Lobosporangium transversale]|eukprot:XP_021878313.1 hypothetical protein BCR41DRAFT_147020 [Lobosporangium transversale]